MHSLHNISRHFDHRGWISEGHPSTTGVAEGDAASIIAMLGIAVFWISSLQHTNASIKAYADNLSWSANSFDTHRECLRTTLEVFSLLRIPIDWDKSWAWCTQKGHTSKWTDLGNELLAQPLKVVSAALDLGVVVNYAPFKRLLSTLDRIEQAKDRLTRMYGLNLTVPIAAKLIQTSVWPKAFYGVEVSSLSPSHFTSIRHAAAQVITHNKKPGIATIALHLVDSALTDPEAYVILQAVRAARKYLFAFPQRFEKFCVMASQANGSSHKVRGPASALKNYLLRLGWSISKQGTLLTNTHLSFHILDTPWPCLKEAILQDWLRDVLVENSERTNLRGLPIPSRKLTISAIKTIPPPQRRGIVREISQAYQIEGQKAKWATDTDGSCRFCPAVDNKQHRHTSCPAMEHIYDKFPDVMPFLKEQDPMHCDFPAVFLPQQHDFHQFCFFQQWATPITEEAQLLTTALSEAGNIPVFFSDGSADNPEHPELTKAAWSLVMFKGDYNQGLESFSVTRNTMVEYQTQFLVAALAPCHGSQNINRAELSALLFLHENWSHSILITDSSYAINSWNLVNSVDDPCRLAFKPNSDLLVRLYNIRTERGNHTVLKVRSHQWDEDTCNGEIRFHVVGNEIADHTAKRANKELNREMVLSLLEDSKQTISEWNLRKRHFQMLTELHAAQTTMTTNRDLQDSLQEVEPFPTNLHESISDVLGRYQPNNTFQIRLDWPADTSLQSQWTSEVASALIQFWGDIQWPTSPVTELETMGISWTEICLSFLIDRNLGVPTPRPHTGVKLRDLTVLKEGGHGFYLVVKSFFWLSTWLNKQLHGAMFRSLSRGMTKSMQKQGSTNQVNGFLSRPLLPAQP